MDELVDDYDTNKQLIELLATSIERWEDGADEFADFNKALAWYLFTRTGLTASVLPGWDNLSSRCTP